MSPCSSPFCHKNFSVFYSLKGDPPCQYAVLSHNSYLFISSLSDCTVSFTVIFLNTVLSFATILHVTLAVFVAYPAWHVDVSGCYRTLTQKVCI
jgi:hypothetical protein